ncbi:MAG: S9 family peptidase [Acidobacteriota bacterium]|nr:S9 family peptidase [Acidobacteriota bacterium]
MTRSIVAHSPRYFLLALVSAVLLLPATLHGQEAAPKAQGASATAPPAFAELLGLDVKPRSADDFVWSPDGQLLAYTWDDGKGQQLRILSVGDGTTVTIAGTEELPKPESFDAAVWAPGSQRLLLLGNGDLYLYDVASGVLSRITETEAEEEDPKFSPTDGNQVAFVRDADLHLLNLADGSERALTSDGKANEILNGKTDWVYWEELWGRDSTGYWWSPDGKALAYYRFEEEGVGIYPLVDFSGPYPQLNPQRYPKAGTTNPKVRVGVLPLAAGSSTTWLDTGDTTTWYLPRVHWKLDGGLAVERLNRDQNRLELLDCSPTGGQCEALITEEEETWVRVGDETRFLANGDILWASDRSGWRHLYLYDGEGNLKRQLTSGEGHVTSVDAVDEASGSIIATRYGRGELGAKDRQVVRIGLGAQGTEILASAAGQHSATVAPQGGHWVHRWTDADNPPRHAVRNAAGEVAAPLPYQVGFDPETLPKWQFFTIPGPEGSSLPAARLLPAGFSETTQYPVIMYHYGGPDSQVVSNSWDSRRRGLWHKWMAARGYVVLMVDNRMSTFFGKKGADLVHRRFGPNNLEAQLAAVEYLRSQPWVDGERIGLWGWSGGGSNTLYALLNSPGTWAAGVSGAPVTSWYFYDTIWTERYLDHPDDNPEGYKNSSPLTYAANLKDPLFIVHGTADDNVHPQNTFVFTKALIDAGIDFEEGIYPGQKHGFKAAETNHFYQRMAAFFDQHVKKK